MNSANSFATWLDERLRERGLTRRELARAMKYSESSLYSWLAAPGTQHYRSITTRSADNLARTLGIHPNEVRAAAGLPSAPSPRSDNGVSGVMAARLLLVPIVGVAPTTNSVRFTAVVGELIPVPAHITHDLIRVQAVVMEDDTLKAYGVNSGDFLILETDPEHMDMQEGDVVIVEVEDGLTPRVVIEVEGKTLLRPVQGMGQQTIAYPQDGVSMIGVARAVTSARML